MSTEQPSQALAVKESKSPIAMGSKGIAFGSYEDLYRFAICVSKSGLAPKGIETPEAIAVVIQHGLEIGLSPMQSLQNIAYINGRPSVWGDAALALCKAHPDFEDVEEDIDGEGDAMVAKCTVNRRNKIPVVRTFAVSEAKKAGLWTKGVWTSYPKRMLQMRARSFALRDAFPDALKGLSIREEAEHIGFDNAKNVTPKEVKASTIELPEEESTSVETVEPREELFAK